MQRAFLVILCACVSLPNQRSDAETEGKSAKIALVHGLFNEGSILLLRHLDPEVVREAALANAKIMVFGELQGEPDNAAQLAIDFQMYLVFGLEIVEANSIMYDAVRVYGPTGFVAEYRRRDFWNGYAAGDGPVTIDTPWGRFGILICDEAHGSHREYVELGAVAILAPSFTFSAEGIAKVDPYADAVKVSPGMLNVYAADAFSFRGLDGTGRYNPATNTFARNAFGTPRPLMFDVCLDAQHNVICDQCNWYVQSFLLGQGVPNTIDAKCNEFVQQYTTGMKRASGAAYYLSYEDMP